MGRPSKLNAELQAAIVADIEAGNYPEVAAGKNGVPRQTFYEWMQRGERGEIGSGGEDFEAFRTAVMRARDAGEADLVTKVRLGDSAGISFGEAKAALEILQRRFPRRWSQKVSHELNDGMAFFLECARQYFAGTKEPTYAGLIEFIAEREHEPSDDTEAVAAH